MGLQTKIEGGQLEKCDQEKLDVFNKTKGPMWMLVNTTIFTEGTDEPKIMLDTMEEMLKALKEDYCAPGAPSTPKPQTGDSCEWAEYEKTGQYLKIIDKLIQEHLFKPKDDNSKVDAQLGFLELRKEFNARVQELFEAGMVCPEKVEKIKKEWMTGANKCMSLFMNSKLKFKEMTRMERIQCTKSLKVMMEDRRSDLLSKELENSIKQFEGASEEGGDAQEAGAKTFNPMCIAFCLPHLNRPLRKELISYFLWGCSYRFLRTQLFRAFTYIFCTAFF